MKTVTRLVVLAALGLLAVALIACANPAPTPSAESTGTGQAASSGFVDVIDLPNGFQPEGIAAQGDSVYIGSIPTGAIYRASIQSGEGTLAVPAQDKRAALGMKITDEGRLYVAGGPTGKAFVYDAATGETLAEYALTTNKNTFINDVALTGNVAWFTDSQAAVLYGVELPAAPAAPTGDETVTALPLTGDFKLKQNAFNLNGIAVAGDQLIVVQSATGMLFTVDPETGATKQINLGSESVTNGDGLLLDGSTLYVVQNQDNKIAVIDLSADLASGTVRQRITSPAFDVPTTLAQVGSSLFTPNARFSTTATADTTYTAVRVNKP